MALKHMTKKLTVNDLSQLIQALIQQDYSVIGPVVQDHAIVYDSIDSLEDLPRGIEDEHGPGHYRLHQKDHDRLFSYVPGPDTWKRFLFPKEEVLYQSTNEDGRVLFKTSNQKKQKRAFFGIRACELHAIAVQDRVFIDGEYADNNYAQRRQDLLFVAVNCTKSAATCFCSSLDTGPKAKSGFDLALTEVCEDFQHYFTLEIGSDLGMQVLDGLEFMDAIKLEETAAAAAVAQAAQQVRSVDTVGLKEKIYASMENNGFWEDLEKRCLNCANCTLVCPTCFCSNVEERTSLDGASHERVKYWDSCFNVAHSHIAGGSVRNSGASRYRQWFSHKFASWQDQFDTLGCTGCGRCVTWCPVGIDVTEEVKRLTAEHTQTFAVTKIEE